MVSKGQVNKYTCALCLWVLQVPTQTCASIFVLLDEERSANACYGLLLALMAGLFQPAELTELWRESSEGAWLDGRVRSDVKPLKPQSNDNQMEDVETAAKICSSLNRISCCLFLEKLNHTISKNFFNFFASEQNPNSWGRCLGHTFYSFTLSWMSQFFSHQKTRWVFSCSPWPGVKNLLMMLEMPISNTQCWWELFVLTWWVSHSAHSKT